MKKKILLLSAVVALMVILPACEETAKEAAQKASKEMCDCLNDHSQSYCEDQLNSNYSSYKNDDAFYSEFNKVNDCNITISKKTN